MRPVSPRLEPRVCRSRRRLRPGRSRLGRSRLGRSKLGRGITLPEVLVLVVIAGILLCLLLPALVRGREMTRKNLCEARITKLIRCVQKFESLSGTFPAGSINPTGPIANEPNGELHHSWITQLLPFMDEPTTFEKINPELSVYDDNHKFVRATLIPTLVCPGSPPPDSSKSLVVRPSSYAACYHDQEQPLDGDNNGVFFLNSKLTQKDIHDGMEYTLFLGEVRLHADEPNLGWMSGTRATLRNTGKPPNSSELAIEQRDKFYMGTFGSWHAGMTHMAMGNGRVTAVSNSIDPIAYQQLGGRKDGAVVPDGASTPASADTPSGK